MKRGDTQSCGGVYCITKENYKTYKWASAENVGKLIQEINIRLAGFGGNVPTTDFTDRTENMIKQFQRNYMKVPETGKICGGLLKAIDEFCEKYKFTFSELSCKCSTKNTKTWDKLQSKTVTNNCNGWGDGSNKTGTNAKYYERPGIHRSLLFTLKAMVFYLEKDNAKFSLRSINSGYRCRFHEEFIKSSTYNHMGTALDLHFNEGNNGRTKDVKNMDWIRKEIFCKYMGAPYFSNEPIAKFGWETNKVGLEPATFKNGKSGAKTWVHVDVREFETKYKEDNFFIKEDASLFFQKTETFATELGFLLMTNCTTSTTDDKVLPSKNNTDRLFSINEAKDALKIIYNKYGEDMAIIVERMYRGETAHFSSGQYKHCGTPGMEVAKGKENESPYYGWGSLDTFCTSNPQFFTVGTWSAMEGKGLSEQGGNAQDTKKPKTFIKMNSVLGGMEFLVDYINKRDGNYAIWYAGNNISNQEKYKKGMEAIIPRFVNEFKNEKK